HAATPVWCEAPAAPQPGPDRRGRRPRTRMNDFGIAMPEDIQRLLSQPFGSLPELIALQATHQPQRAALILDGRSLDYADLRAGMDRVALSLQRHGLRPGDVAAICASTSVAYVLAYLGALRAGVAVAPLAPSATAAHLSAMLDNSGARLVLRDREVAAQWPVQAGQQLHCVALDDAPEAGEPWSQWLARTPRRPRRSRPRPTGPSTSSTPPAPPACPRASCSPGPCAGL